MEHYASPHFRLLQIYIFIFVLWPFYIDIRVQENLGVNPQRIFLIFVLFFWITAFFVYPSIRKNFFDIFDKNKKTMCFLFFYFLCRLLSVVFNASAYSASIFLYETLSELSLFLFVCTSLRSYKEIKGVVFVLFFCAVVLAFLSVFEWAYQANFFSQFADPSTKAGMTASLIKVRDGNYRVQGTFEHPLTLVQFFVTVFPLGYYFFYKKSANKIFVAAAGFLILLAMYFTYSRSAVVALLFSFCIVFFIKLKVMENNIYDGRKRILLSVFRKIFFVLFVVGGVGVIVAMSSGGSDSENASATTRLFQMKNGWLAIKNKPFVGFGPGEAIRVIMDTGDRVSEAEKIWNETVDNLFLTKMIESGIPALLFYVFFLISVQLKLFKYAVTEEICSNERNLAVAILASLSGGFISMSILSIFTALPIYFCILGLAVGLLTYKK